MPTETQWYLEKRIIISRARGEITLDEFTSMGKVLDEYRQEGTAPVHWILDTREVKKPILDLGLARKTFQILKHEDFGWTMVLVSKPNRLMSFLASAVAQTLGLRYRLVHELDEALAFLRERDATLNLEQDKSQDADLAKK